MSKCRYDLSADCNNTDCLNCVLNKIKAEIAKRTIEQGFDADEWSISYDELMNIIDKYKGESEE